MDRYTFDRGRGRELFILSTEVDAHFAALQAQHAEFVMALQAEHAEVLAEMRKYKRRYEKLANMSVYVFRALNAECAQNEISFEEAVDKLCSP